MKKLGFTLAEVLITLVIIGVIASMTIPVVMRNTDSQQYRVALKKSISVLNEALAMSYALDGLTAQDYTTPADLVQYIFESRMNTMDGAASSFTNSTVCTQGSTFATADGMVYCVSSNFNSATTDSETASCDAYSKNPCATSTSEPNLWIDVNGSKKPNKVTTSAASPKDIYQAMIYAQKVVPYGRPTQEVMMEKGETSQAQTKASTKI